MRHVPEEHVRRHEYWNQHLKFSEQALEVSQQRIKAIQHVEQLALKLEFKAESVQHG